MDYQRLLLDHLDLVNQIVRAVGRRRHLSAAELEDFASFVHLRMIEDDYAILRKFRNRSTLWTYLATVIERLSLDFCAEQWGRWSPSAKAERIGPVAVALERLVYRDATPLEEALEILRTNHGIGLTDGELRKIWEQLPLRVRNIEVGEEAAHELSSNDQSEVAVEDTARQEIIKALQETLRNSFGRMASQDRVLVALRFDQDLSIVEISKLTGRSVASLHRHLDMSLKRLRRALSRAGFDPREVASLIGHPSIGLSPLLRKEVESFLGQVRLSKRDG